MPTARKKKQQMRQASLRAILEHERNQALARIREYRQDQDLEATPPPGDEMDVARSLADVETHATLIERVEERLKAIDSAFDRLEHDRYGICARCGEEIPVERLKALPFAIYCVDCQQKINNDPRIAKTWVDEPFIRRWDPPEEMEESTENSRDDYVPLPTGEEDDGGLTVGKEEPAPTSPKPRKKTAL